jgi:hypothetical protein
MTRRRSQNDVQDSEPGGENILLTERHTPPRQSQALRGLLSLMGTLEDAQPSPDLIARTLERVEQLDALGPLGRRFT